MILRVSEPNCKIHRRKTDSDTKYRIVIFISSNFANWRQKLLELNLLKIQHWNWKHWIVFQHWKFVSVGKHLKGIKSSAVNLGELTHWKGQQRINAAKRLLQLEDINTPTPCAKPFKHSSISRYCACALDINLISEYWQPHWTQLTT